MTRAEAGLQKLTRSGQQVTFRGVAKAAGVSLEFLYNHPQLRSRIEHLRAQQQTRPAQRRDIDPDQPSNVIAALTGQLTQLKRRHREQITELQHALEAAHGENLLLRRRLGQQPQHPGPGPADELGG